MIERTDGDQFHQIDVLPRIDMHDVKMLLVLINLVFKPEYVLKDSCDISSVPYFDCAVS